MYFLFFPMLLMALAFCFFFLNIWLFLILFVFLSVSFKFFSVLNKVFVFIAKHTDYIYRREKKKEKESFLFYTNIRCDFLILCD